ncbi:MAG: hypothetical protein AAF085_07830, partial [Planctomycetota bacterium]
QFRIGVSLLLLMLSATFFVISLASQPIVSEQKFVMMFEETEQIYREGNQEDPEAQEILKKNRERTVWLAEDMSRGRYMALASSAISLMCFLAAFLIVALDTRLRSPSSHPKQPQESTA